MPDAAPESRGVYTPRRPQVSPLFQLLSDDPHWHQTVYDERVTREYGRWRPVVALVADKFFTCGVAVRRCDSAHEARQVATASRWGMPTPRPRPKSC
jgi:hypothetical protein